MKLLISTSKNAKIYYVAKSFLKGKGKYSSKIVERLGTIDELAARFGSDNPEEAARAYVKELAKKEKESRQKISVEYSPSIFIKAQQQSFFNGGYLFLQKVYHDLGLHTICEKISKKYKFKYNLNEILSKLLYTRVMYPSSKQSSLEESKRFIEQPEIELHQIYRALSVLAQESDYIQSAVYKNSLKLGERKDKVIYYDCTNYYFESEEEKGLRQYGYSKEHRPNPIVQMGLFMDMESIPLAFNINSGNTNEHVTLKPLEDKLVNNFGVSKMVVCTDAGLSSLENRKNNSIPDRSFITVQSLKKCKKHIQDWALNEEGWHLSGSEDTYNLNDVNPDECYNRTFYKDRWINENGLEQRIIVTFSFKYRSYLQHLRDRPVERANEIIESGRAARRKKSANDASRFIKQENCTQDGELAQITNYSLNKEMVEQEAKFDGFYAVCTDLEDHPSDILKVNSRRWIIEDAFRIMKTEFEARPVFLQRDDRIKAHFLTCFLALVLYKYLEKKINKGRDKFSVGDIIGTLTDMNFLSVAGEGYIPTYTRTKITNALHGAIGFRTDTQIVTKQNMRSIISFTRNSRSSKEKEKERKEIEIELETNEKVETNNEINNKINTENESMCVSESESNVKNKITKKVRKE